MVYVRYLGHSSFHVQMAGRELYFDPWLDSKPKEMPRLVPPAISSDTIKKADIIFVSHEHSDHADPYDVNTLVERTAAKVVAPSQTLAVFKIPPRSQYPVNEGDEFSMLGLDVTVVEARHPRSEHPVGFIVRGEGKSLYFAGDTYDYYGMSDYTVDTAILPIGGTYTMDVFSAIKALKQLRARYVIPMHYNTFDRIQVDTADFARRVKDSTHTEPVVLGVGQSIHF